MILLLMANTCLRLNSWFFSTYPDEILLSSDILANKSDEVYSVGPHDSPDPLSTDSGADKLNIIRHQC